MDRSKELTGRDPFVDKTKVTITRGDPKTNNPAISGEVKGHPGYTFSGKVFDGGSRYGINGGRVSKLYVEKNGVEVFRYERIWVDKPVTKEQKAVLKKILEAFPSPTLELKQKMQRGKDKISEEFIGPLQRKLSVKTGRSKGGKISKGERVCTPENPMGFFTEYSGGASKAPSKGLENTEKLKKLVDGMKKRVQGKSRDRGGRSM